MKRRGALLVLGLWVTPAVLAAQAQVTFNLSDTVLAVPLSLTGSVELDLYTNCDGVGSYSVTLFVDRARVHLAGVDSVPGYGLAAPAVDSSIAGQYTLTGGPAPTAYCTQPLALLAFDVGSTTASGSLVSARLNSAVGLSPAVDITPGYRSDVMDVCQADKISGDVDGSLTINSRDALVVLTAAVGLSVPGTFDLTVGDVDGDQQVTSRDALLILSAGIGLLAPYGVTAGRGIPARCAPLEPAPADMVFLASAGMVRVAGGDTTRVPVPLVDALQTGSSPRWAPDGSLIAYECYNPAWTPYAQTICLVQPNGTLVRHLDLVANYRAYSPGWMPQGWRIAYLNSLDGNLWVANVDSSNAAAVTSGYTISDLAWAPDGHHIAFVGTPPTGGLAGLYVVSVDSLTVREVFPSSSSQYPAEPSWSPAGDSLSYFSGLDSRVYGVASVGSSGPGAPAVPLASTQYYGAWLTTGIGFQSGITSNDPSLFLHRSDGRDLRLTRALDYTGDYRVDFRRAGVAYVDTVTVSPTSATLTPTAPTTFTATVTNSDGSTDSTAPLTWISRDPSVATVAPTGLRTANATAIATGSTYIVVTVGGWRSDSALVTVP